MVPSTCHRADPGTNRRRGYLSESPSETRALAKKPNYNFEKNRREQDRKKKQEEKRLRKLENSRRDSTEPSGDDAEDGAVPPAE
jgi:hypothetical protein